jgi:hypothetical protein
LAAWLRVGFPDGIFKHAGQIILAGLFTHVFGLSCVRKECHDVLLFVFHFPAPQNFKFLCEKPTRVFKLCIPYFLSLYRG